MSRITKILIAFLLLDSIGAGLLWYAYTNMQKKKTEEMGLRKELVEENKKAQKIVSLRRSIELAEPDRVALEQYLFDSRDENLIKFNSQMERLGIVTTGALVETRVLDRAGVNVHGEFAITGSWSQLYHLLRVVEEIPTRVVINRFDMRRADISNGTGKESAESWSGSISLDLTSVKSGQ